MSEQSHDHPAACDADRLKAECSVRRLRRSGPGGQNRNKVETAVVLHHDPTGLIAEANERRSQAENLKVALFRLRVQLALEVRRPVSLNALPSALWSSRIAGGRIVVSPSHDDFPTLLAESLDVLAAHGDDVKSAASALGCSSSQFVRFLKLEPRALAQLNQRRHQAGQRALL